MKCENQFCDPGKNFNNNAFHTIPEYLSTRPAYFLPTNVKLSGFQVEAFEA